MMYLFGVIVIIWIFLEMVILLLKITLIKIDELRIHMNLK